MASSKTRRWERTPEQQAAAQEARTDRLEALHQQLAAGVEAIRDGQAWADWLTIAGRLHTYSFNNQILIAIQKPEARMVAGYGAWQAMGRQVRKGEKAIWILAPVTRRARPDADGTLDGDDLVGTSPAPDPATTGSGRGGGRLSGSGGRGCSTCRRPTGTRSPPHRSRNCSRATPHRVCGMR